MFKASACDQCDRPTDNKPNEFDEIHCDDCEQAAAERGWERFCSDFYGGADPFTVREKQIADWKSKP